MRENPKRSGLQIMAVTLVSVLFSLASPVLAEQTEVEKRIEKLEAELQEIKASIKEDATAGGKPKGLTDQQKAEGKAKLAASDHVNYNAEWNLGTPKEYVPDRGWMPIFLERSEIRLCGWIQAALFHDFQGNLVPDEQEFSAGLAPGPVSRRMPYDICFFGW